MKNAEIHGYKNMKIIDSHVHIEERMNIDRTVEIMREVTEHFGYDKININSLPDYGETQNIETFYCKAKLAPRVFANIGIHHNFDAGDTSDFYLDQIKRYHAMGCDGIKLLGGKITLYRKLKKRLDDKVFDKLYGYMEENQIPIISHVGDPITFWDINKMWPYALEQGWYCDENDPTMEDFRDQLNGILKKFPKLKLTLAHFYFMGDDIEGAAEFMDKWENVTFDLTPGGEMFAGFNENHKEARLFFEKYSDRILYGSDIFNRTDEGIDVEELHGVPVNRVRSFLEKSEPYEDNTLYTDTYFEPKPIVPFNLSDEILEKIYYKNYVRLYGPMPKMLDTELIAHECEFIMGKKLDAVETENAQKILNYFRK